MPTTAAQRPRVETSTLTLANASELVRCVMSQIAGDNVGDTLNGQPLREQLVAAHVTQRLKKQLGV